MTQLFVNNAATILSGDITIGATSLSVQSGDGALFPLPTGGDFFLMTLHTADFSAYEVVKVSSRSGDTLTVLRGYEGTPAAWTAGTSMASHLTKQTMVDLQTATAAAQSAADAAQTDATDALTQLAEGGSAGAAVHRVFSVSSQNWGANGNADASTQQMVCLCIKDGRINIDTDTLNVVNTETFQGGTVFLDFPMNLGYTLSAANKIQVFVNGVKQRMVQYDEYLVDGWMWCGHNALHLYPSPALNAYVEILGFEADDWTVPNVQVTDYSWFVNGRTSAGTDTSNVIRFNWATHTRTARPASSYASYDGSGGTTDGTNGRIFGGNNNAHDQHWAKMLISTEAWTFFSSALTANHKNNGCATNGTYSYLFGSEQSLNWTYIERVVHATDVDSVLGATTTNGYIRGDAASNAGQTFAMYLPGAPTSTNWKNKFTYSSETIAATNSGTASFNNTNYKSLVTFYDDIGYYTGGYKVDYSTEAWSATSLNHAATSLTQTSQHEVYSDGGTHMFGKRHKMIYPTEVVVNFVSNDVDLTHNNSTFLQVGVFSDTWGASK